MNTIPADPATLTRQAAMTTAEHLAAAIGYIDERLGKGYAKRHPELIGAFIQAAAQDFDTAISAQTLQDTTERLCGALGALQPVLREAA